LKGEIEINFLLQFQFLLKKLKLKKEVGYLLPEICDGRFSAETHLVAKENASK